MKTYINIPQQSIMQSGLDLDIQDACIIDFILLFSHSNSIKKVFIGSKPYYWFDYSHVAVNLPLLRIKKDTVYRRFKNLVNLELLEPHHENQLLGKPYYAITDKMIGLFTTIGFKSDTSDSNPNPYGKKSVPPTDENPYNSNIIDSKIIDSNLNSNGELQATPPFVPANSSEKKIEPPVTKTDETKERAQKFVTWFNEYRAKRLNLKVSKYTCTDDVLKNFKKCISKYTNKEIMKAVKNMFEDEHHIKHNFKFSTPEFILRIDKIEVFSNMIIEQQPEQKRQLVH